MGDLVLRPAEAADADAVADLWLASFAATYEFRGPHTDDQVRAWVRDVVVARRECWVAEDGQSGAIVGMMALAPGELDQLYVAPSRLGEGIGSALVALARARQPGGLALYTFQVNDGARRFYARHGFAEVSLGDGSANEERQPDVRMAWVPAGILSDLHPGKA